MRKTILAPIFIMLASAVALANNSLYCTSNLSGEVQNSVTLRFNSQQTAIEIFYNRNQVSYTVSKPRMVEQGSKKQYIAAKDGKKIMLEISQAPGEMGLLMGTIQFDSNNPIAIGCQYMDLKK